MNRKNSLIIWGGAILGVLSVIEASAAQTIVGKWKPLGKQCTGFDGAISIGPMDIAGHEFRCNFSDVSRRGDVVRWIGVCNDYDADERRTNVTASLNGERLAVSFDKEAPSVYQRCR